MENWIYAGMPVILKTVVTCVGIFAVIILITRVSGLRTFAKMSSFDFASTIAIGSILAAVIMNGQQSMLKGGVALASIVALQSMYAWMGRKWSGFADVAQNQPILLMRDGEIFHKALDAVNVGEDTLMAKLREANAMSLGEVRAVVFETTGDVSVLHGEAEEFEERLLQGVNDEYSS